MTAPISLDLEGLEVFYDQPAGADADPANPGQRFHLRIPRLQLRGGQMIGIAGRSGEGKSTLLHVLALLLQPPVVQRLSYEYPGADGPRSFSFSRPGAETPDPRLAQVRNEAFGFIFQQHFLLPYFEVRDNVALPVMVRPGYRAALYRERIGQLLDGLGLPVLHRRKRPSQLSGGQNQRVAVARALLHDPPFLFADEPTANLDKHKREMVLRQLRAAADAGRCVVLVSHELGDIAAYCDRVLMVQDNRLLCPFAGDPHLEAEAGGKTLPALAKEGGGSVPRSRADVAWITGELSNHIWPVAADSKEKPAAAAPELAPLPPSRPGTLGLRKEAFKYASHEMLNKKGAAMRALMFLMLLAACCIFSYLSDLGRGAMQYLTEATLNKPSEYLNRIVISRKDSTKRLTPEQVAFLANEVPGLKAPPTFRQRLFQYEFFTPAGERERKNYAYSVPEGDDTLAPVDPADKDTAQIGVVYLKGGPFKKGDADRAGVIVSRRFLRRSYWGLGDRADAPDGKIPDEIEFRLPLGDAGVVEDDVTTWLPGINGRVRVPVVGVFDYPTVVVKNTTGGEEGLPQLFFPERFMRRLGTAKDKPVWRWYDGFLCQRCGDGKPLVAGYDVLRSATIRVKGGTKDAAWLKKTLADPRSELSRDLARGLAKIAPYEEGGAVVLRFDKAREEPSQKLTAEKFEAVHWPEIKATLVKLTGGEAVLEYQKQPASALFSEASLASLPDNEEVYSEAVLRLKGFQNVLPARRVVEKAHGDAFEIEPKGGQVTALERFESISTVMGSGYIALQATFALFLAFLIGITAYMHITSKTSDIGILRSYGLSPPSIAWVYFLELAMLTVPACVLGIVLAVGLGRASNDLIAQSLVLTAKQQGEEETKKAGEPMPKVFLSQQQGLLANLGEAGKTVGLLVAILVVVSVLSVAMIRRQQIVDSLRAGAG
ncbi:MAG: ATP-binding cassette domain-containing protein [Gemmataceae bacterium]|nr:ATP-binding cassette domain-containing protein [Gemmataceae bacterium]